MKVVVDTNVILHGKSLEELPWKEILGRIPDEVLLPHPVLKELDEKRYDPRHCERARKRSKALCDLIDEKRKSKIGISYNMMELDSSIEESRQKSSSADDRISDDILKYEKQINEKVILLTSDRFFSKIASRSIEVKRLDDKYLEIDDSKNKEIEKLKSKIKKIENRMPELKVCFEDKETKRDEDKETKRDIVLDYKRRNLDSYKNKLLKKCPLLTHPDNRPIENKSIAGLVDGGLIRALMPLPPPKEEYERYSKERKEYFKEVDLHIEDMRKYDEVHSRAFEFELLIDNNTGTHSASSVSIHLHFPDGFKLIDLDCDEVDEIEYPPEPPNPPEKPTNSLKKRGFTINDHSRISDVLSSAFRSQRRHQLKNIRPTIKKVNSYVVQHPLIDKIMHCKHFSLGRFKVFFNSHEDIKSFQVDCTIHCEEFLKQKKQKLHFIIKDKK